MTQIATSGIKFCWNQLIFLLQLCIGGFCCFLDLFLLDMAVAVQVNDGGEPETGTPGMLQP